MSINLLVRTAAKQRPATIRYASTERDWRKEKRLAFLDRVEDRSGVAWQTLHPDRKNTWLTNELAPGFDSLMPVGSKETKAGEDDRAVFRLYSLGVNTNRDSWAYNFNRETLQSGMQTTIDFYNEQLDRWLSKTHGQGAIDNFVSADSTRISWSEGLKNHLKRRVRGEFCPSATRQSLYRPFTRTWLYFDPQFNERRYQMPLVLPTIQSEAENKMIWVKTGSEVPMFALATNILPNALPQGGSQCFPFYIYDEDGSNRRENITDWALNEYRTHYHDRKITKWDIFHYVYALLHHPDYRERYAANLKRELPRIPYAPDFWGFAKAGKQLADLHVNYEKQPENPLERMENPNEKISYRVEKMRLGKDKMAIMYNSFLTLSGIPSEVYEYRLGNRSALEWVIDQYQVSTDKRSGITNDPNREDDPEYIVRLIGQVITVSKETVRIVKALPDLGIAASAATV